jgi:hypothetical protein
MENKDSYAKTNINYQKNNKHFIQIKQIKIMKKLVLLFAAILMVACFSNKVMSQAVTATLANNVANATVLSAISLYNDQVLEFGAFVPDAANSGTVTMDLLDGRTCDVVTGVSVTVTPMSAQFTTSGTKLAAYTITIPTAPFDITNTSDVAPHATMAISGMTCTAGLTHQIDAGGTDVFKVGGVLAVAAAQEPGLYTGTYSVTVAY